MAAADHEARRRQATFEATAAQLVAGYYLGADGIETVCPPWWPDHLAKGCRHLDEPQVMFSHVSDPATVRCGSCSVAFMKAAVEVDPDGCDWCGEPAPDRRFREVVIRHQHVICVGNICRPCYETDALHHERPRHAPPAR